MNFEELNAEELQARMAEIRTAVDAEDADLDALETEARAIKEELERRVSEEAQRAEIREKLANEELPTETIEKHEERKEMTNAEVRNSKEYIDAYAEYIKSGNDAECRALLTENVSGTVPVPEFVYDEVKTAWNREGIIRRVRKAYLKGNLKVGFEISATGATVHTEGGDPVAEETLVLGVVNLVPKSIKKWISISDEVYDLRGEAFLRYIYDELTYQIAKKAADELITAIEACGTVSTTTCPGVPKVTANSIAMGTVASAIGNLSDEAARPVIMMNKATWAAFKAVQYANGFAADPFEGLDVEFNNTIKSFAAATTGETYAIVGDLDQGALMNLPNGEGIDFKFDDKTDMAKDLIRILGRMYAGIGVVAPNAFVKICK
ncbi:MAG: phage major capsid protein [Spirochaetales bacterium]|nr:phage major capsid protein [Spirochaetales bacterium]